MAEFGAGGAGLRDEDRRARKEGKKLLKQALGAAGMGGFLQGGKHKEKLRREKQRRRDAEARTEAERRTAMAARRAELHQRAVAEAAERRRQADSKSHAEDRARATDALEAERAAARARAQREAETERRCQATERALDGAQRKEQDLREQLRTMGWDLETAERERARWYADSEQARSTAEAQRSRAQFYVAEAQRRDASGDSGNHRAGYLEAELERLERERELEREQASRQARITETQLRFAEAELGRTRRSEAELGRWRARQWAHNQGWGDMFEQPGPAPTPSEPFYGLHTFSVGTSSAPKRGKAGRRILKAKRPPRMN